MIPLPSPSLIGLVFRAFVNILETPRTCGLGVIAFEERPVIQQRGKKTHIAPQMTVGIHIGMIQS